MEDKIALLDKLNNDVRNLQQTVDSLSHYSIKDANAIHQIENRYEIDRKELIEHLITNTEVITKILERVETLEARLGELSPTDSQIRQPRGSVLQYMQTLMKKLFRLK